MFDVAKDRLSYGELLRPDVGYRLDFAVGMTYSLDLEGFKTSFSNWESLIDCMFFPFSDTVVFII